MFRIGVVAPVFRRLPLPTERENILNGGGGTHRKKMSEVKWGDCLFIPGGVGLKV